MAEQKRLNVNVPEVYHYAFSQVCSALGITVKEATLQLFEAFLLRDHPAMTNRALLMRGQTISDLERK